MTAFRTLTQRRRHTTSPSAPVTGINESARALRRGGLALAVNSALTSGLGVIYWLAAAHLYGRTDVGRGSSLIAALWTVSGLAQLNYARSLSGLLPRAQTRARRLLVRVYGLVALLSLLAGTLFAVVAPLVSPGFSFIHSSSYFVPLFALSIPAWSIFSLEDTVLATVRRAVIIPFENAIFAVSKLIVLVVFALTGYVSASAIYLSWVAPLLFIVVPINVYLFRRAVPAFGATVRDVPPRSGRWVRYDFAGYLMWLLGTAPLPVLVLAVLGPSASASFYVPFTIATSIDVLSLNVGNSLTAELARHDGRWDDAIKRFVRRLMGVLAVISILTFLAAPYALAAFGHSYQTASTTVLRCMALAVVPRAATFLAIAAARAEGRGPLIALLQGILCFTTLILGLTLMSALGVVGMAVAWLVSSSMTGALAAATSGFGLARRPTAPSSELTQHPV